MIISTDIGRSTSSADVAVSRQLKYSPSEWNLDLRRCNHRLGTMGTFASLEFARRGRSVIGFDQFAPPHDRGSHSGATRIFRTAYAEHPDYVPLALRAGVLWDRYGAEQGTTLLHRTGMLNLGSPDSHLVSGARASAAAHNLTIENLTRSQIRSKFPVFDVPVGWEGVLERSAGWIDVNEALRLGLEQAARAGVALRINTRVEGWSWTGDRFAVRTSAETVIAAHLIVTAGAWASRILADLALPLKVRRKVLIWVDPLRDQSISRVRIRQRLLLRVSEYRRRWREACNPRERRCARQQS